MQCKTACPLYPESGHNLKANLHAIAYLSLGESAWKERDVRRRPVCRIQKLIGAARSRNNSGRRADNSGPNQRRRGSLDGIPAYRSKNSGGCSQTQSPHHGASRSGATGWKALRQGNHSSLVRFRSLRCQLKRKKRHLQTSSSSERRNTLQTKYPALCDLDH